jgi:hypothetical protein
MHLSPKSILMCCIWMISNGPVMIYVTDDMPCNSHKSRHEMRCYRKVEMCRKFAPEKALKLVVLPFPSNGDIKLVGTP